MNQEIKNLELALECLLNEDDAQASELIHSVFVSKARTIIEGFEADDAEDDFEDEVVDGSDEEMFSDDELSDEDGEDEFAVDDMEGEGTEERLADLEDALEELQAEFAALSSMEAGEPEHEGEIDVDSDGDVEIDGEEEFEDEDGEEEDDSASEIEDDEDELDAEEMNESVELSKVKVPTMKADGEEVGSGSTGKSYSGSVNTKTVNRDNVGKGGIKGSEGNLMKGSDGAGKAPVKTANGKPVGVPKGTSEVKNRVNGKVGKDGAGKKEKASLPLSDDSSAKAGPVSGKKIR